MVKASEVKVTRACPACRREIASRSWATHERSRGHRLAAYHHEQGMVRELAARVVALGGRVVKDEPNEHDPLGDLGDHIALDRVELAIHTLAGPLTIHASRGATIFARFADAEEGRRFAGASVPSGKWNHHYADCVLRDEDVDSFVRQLRRIAVAVVESTAGEVRP